MRLMQFEHLGEPLARRWVFLQRLGANLLVAVVLIAVSLLAGMIGYRSTEGLSWLDAFLNASMILSGMGPINTLTYDSAKLFAGFYALYSGLALVVIASLVLAPVFHRVLHGLHVQDENDEKTPTKRAHKPR
jgi:hypothetical protein